MAGPLRLEVEAFAAGLERLGYSHHNRYVYPRVVQMFDDYLARKSVKTAGAVARHIGGFLAEVRTRRKSLRKSDPIGHWWGRALDLLLKQLRDKGLLPPLPSKAMNPRLVEYLGFLSEHCGLSATTIRRHEIDVGNFLGHLRARTDADLASISAKAIDEFIIKASRTRCRRSMEIITGALRGFLGHLFVQGIVRTDLREQVVTPRIYSLETLPRSIPWRDVRRTLASISGRGVLARRDRAILILLGVCGLRANEVANLRVDHIDWRRDLIQLHRSKSRSVEDIPLVPEVGEALIAYLQKRPPGTPHPQVFLTVRAPLLPLTRSQISIRARKHLLRAGVQAPHLGAHTLRHSHAMHLLRRGFSLKAIGDSLGHSSPQSTMVYTKGAVEDLREVAQEIEGVQP